MNAIERSMKETEQTEVSFEQYKSLVNLFKVRRTCPSEVLSPSSVVVVYNDVQQIEKIAHDVKSLSTLLDELMAEEATGSPVRHRQRLERLLSRYKHLLGAINDTSQRCSLIIAAKIVHEKSSHYRSEIKHPAQLTSLFFSQTLLPLFKKELTSSGTDGYQKTATKTAITAQMEKQIDAISTTCHALQKDKNLVGVSNNARDVCIRFARLAFETRRCRDDQSIETNGSFHG
jgi:ElaB/YqjD/DUF883 family membrane-anchored ribosome-binding protein